MILSIGDLVALLSAVLPLDVTLLLVSGVLAVGAALLALDARNQRREAAEDRDAAEWALRQARRLDAAIRADADLYPTAPVESDEDVDDAPAELGDAAEEQEPTRPLFYRRRHRITIRQRYERWENRASFDLADVQAAEAVVPPVAELPEAPVDEPVEAPISGPPLVVAGVVAAEGVETTAEFNARVHRELDTLFAKITVGAR